MGVSTDAILFYGYCWKEEQEWGEEITEWVSAVFKKRGHPNPWDTYPNYGERSSPNYIADYAQQRAATDAWTSANREKLDAYYAVKRSIEGEFGVRLASHQSGDYPIPYLCIDRLALRAARGYPVQIQPGNMVVSPTPDDDAKLDKWFAEMGIEKPHESPKWWLVSYWG